MPISKANQPDAAIVEIVEIVAAVAAAVVPAASADHVPEARVLAAPAALAPVGNVRADRAVHVPVVEIATVAAQATIGVGRAVGSGVPMDRKIAGRVHRRSRFAMWCVWKFCPIR